MGIWHKFWRLPSTCRQFSHSVVSNSLWPHGRQHARLPCPCNSWSLLKLLSIESVMPSNHLILCRALLLPSIFPCIRVFSNESALHIYLLYPGIKWLISATTCKKTLLIGLWAGPSISHRAEEEETAGGWPGWRLCHGKGPSMVQAPGLREQKSVQITSSDAFENFRLSGTFLASVGG